MKWHSPALNHILGDVCVPGNGVIKLKLIFFPSSLSLPYVTATGDLFCKGGTSDGGFPPPALLHTVHFYPLVSFPWSALSNPAAQTTSDEPKLPS